MQPLSLYPTASGSLLATAQTPSFDLDVYDTTNLVPSNGWNVEVWYNWQGAGIPDRGSPILTTGFDTASGVIEPAVEQDLGYGGIDGRPAGEGFFKRWSGYTQITPSGTGTITQDVSRNYMAAGGGWIGLYVGPTGTLPSDLGASNLVVEAWPTSTPLGLAQFTEPSHQRFTASGHYTAGEWKSIRVDWQGFANEAFYNHCIVGYYDVDPSGTVG